MPVHRYAGKCMICDYETEPLEDETEAKDRISEHITEYHVDDYIDNNTGIIESEEV
jgi:predicted small metal-binding protein